MVIRIMRKSDQHMIASQVRVAETFWPCARGWIGRTDLDAEEGLLFPRCNSIHMWFMKTSIDVVFMKRTGSEWQVIKLCRSVRPWSPLPIGAIAADDTLELPEGSIDRALLRVGEVLCIAS